MPSECGPARGTQLCVVSPLWSSAQSFPFILFSTPGQSLCHHQGAVDSWWEVYILVEPAALWPCAFSPPISPLILFLSLSHLLFLLLSLPWCQATDLGRLIKVSCAHLLEGFIGSQGSCHLHWRNNLSWAQEEVRALTLKDGEKKEEGRGKWNSTFFSSIFSTFPFQAQINL